MIINYVTCLVRFWWSIHYASGFQPFLACGNFSLQSLKYGDMSSTLFFCEMHGVCYNIRQTTNSAHHSLCRYYAVLFNPYISGQALLQCAYSLLPLVIIGNSFKEGYSPLRLFHLTNSERPEEVKLQYFAKHKHTKKIKHILCIRIYLFFLISSFGKHLRFTRFI